MPQNPFDEKSTLVQVMAWCHQAKSHYLIQCWRRLMSPYIVIRPQWVNNHIKWCPKGTIPYTCGAPWPQETVLYTCRRGYPHVIILHGCSQRCPQATALWHWVKGVLRKQLCLDVVHCAATEQYRIHAVQSALREHYYTHVVRGALRLKHYMHVSKDILREQCWIYVV